MSASPGCRARRLLIAAAVCAGVALPAAPAAAEVPDAAPVVGELVQAWPEEADAAEHGSDAPLSWVRTAAGETVRVPTGDVADVPAGSTVSVVVGDRVDDDAADDGYAAAQEVVDADVLRTPAPAPAAAVPGPLTNDVTVAMVVPAGGVRDGTTLAQVVAAVNGPVAQFWAGQTGGGIRLGVTATHDWMSTRAGCSDPNALWAEVARTVGFVPGPHSHLVVYLSSLPADLPGCSYALGQVGSAPSSGGSVYVRDPLPSLLAHELGHNFGLGHSSGLRCAGAVDSGSCSTAGYRDYYDVMGASWSQLGALTAAQADRLGLLTGAAQAVVAPATDADWTLAPLAGAAGTRALRLPSSGGDYWLEYRAPAAQDAWLATPANRFGLDAGVLLHRSGAMPDTSLLLDGTPSAAGSDLQAALPVGVPVALDGGAFTVTVAGLRADGAAVRVVAAPRVPAAGAPAPATPGGVLPGRSTGTTAGAAAPAIAPSGTPAPATAPAPAAAEVPVAAADASAAVDAVADGSPAALREAAHSSGTGGAGRLLAWCAVAAGAGLLLAVGLRLRARR